MSKQCAWVWESPNTYLRAAAAAAAAAAISAGGARRERRLFATVTLFCFAKRSATPTPLLEAVGPPYPKTGSGSKSGGSLGAGSPRGAYGLLSIPFDALRICADQPPSESDDALEVFVCVSPTEVGRTGVGDRLQLRGGTPL